MSKKISKNHASNKIDCGFDKFSGIKLKSSTAKVYHFTESDAYMSPVERQFPSNVYTVHGHFGPTRHTHIHINK